MGNAEEKSKRAMVDAARLADELRAEQDHATAENRGKRTLDTQIGELENRLADAEASAMKAGKAAMSKLEMRIRELEMELSGIQTHTQDSYKAFTRAERRVKELQFQQDEDEEIAALNLAKFRKAQQELEETDERAKLAEQSIGVMRMKILNHKFHDGHP